MDDKIRYTEEIFWYTEKRTSYVTVGKLCYMDDKIRYTEEILWYTEEEYKLCYTRKPLLHGQQNLIHGSDTRRKNTSYVTLGKLRYMDDQIWYREEIFGGKIKVMLH